MIPPKWIGIVVYLLPICYTVNTGIAIYSYATGQLLPSLSGTIWNKVLLAAAFWGVWSLFLAYLRVDHERQVLRKELKRERGNRKESPRVD